jgi:hypothetical protein
MVSIIQYRQQLSTGESAFQIALGRQHTIFRPSIKANITAAQGH